MRFLANENFPADAVEALRVRGHDVAWIRIVLFRISAPSSAHVTRTAVAALESRSDWVGHFAVVEDTRIRMTPLPR